jgi:Flp pilus assembly protein CpaB
MLTLGVLLAVVAFGGVLIFGSSPGSTTPGGGGSEVVTVVTAAQDVLLGTALDETLLATIEMPTADAVDTYRDPAQLLGLVVRRTVRQGEAFRSTDFNTAGGLSAPEIASNLAPGQRAMAIAIDPLSAVGSLIQVGDYVDVMLAMTDQPDPTKFPVMAPFTNEDGLPVSSVGGDGINNTSVKVLVQNVQVLGIVSPPLGPEGGNEIDPVTGLPLSGRGIAIISVTPQEAEIIRFTQLDGNLSLIMRSPQDAAAADESTTGITLRQLVDLHGVLPPRPVVIPLP